MTCKRCHPSENCTRYALLLLLNWCFWGSFFSLLFSSIVSSIPTYNVQWSEAKRREKSASLFTCTWINWCTRVILTEMNVSLIEYESLVHYGMNINKIVEIDTSSRNFDFMSDFIGRMNDRQNDHLLQIHATVMCGYDPFKQNHFVKFHSLLHVPHN